MTIKQRQNLLAYLGFYLGDIDGKWGSMSELATRCFQRDFGLKDDGVCGKETERALKHAVSYGMPVKESEHFWENVNYFNRSEFRCKCGKCGGFPVEPDKRLVGLLDKLRAHFGVPVTINSAVRCKTHNANVGGASNSQHLKGTAADIRVNGVSPKEVAAYAETLLPGTGGIGIYSWGIHFDVRTTKSRWNG